MGILISFLQQGASSPDPTTVYVDLRALRNDRVTLTERGAPHSLALMESGKLLPGVNVIIANADTKGQCGDSHLGEVRLISCTQIIFKTENTSYLSIYEILIIFDSDLGTMPPQCQWILHNIWR